MLYSLRASRFEQVKPFSRSNPVVAEYKQTLDAYTRALKAFNNMFTDSDKARIDKNSKLTIVGDSKWKKKHTG